MTQKEKYQQVTFIGALQNNQNIHKAAINHNLNVRTKRDATTCIRLTKKENGNIKDS